MKGFTSFKSGPTWARTKDPLIMSRHIIEKFNTQNDLTY